MPTLADIIEQYLRSLVENAGGNHIEIIRSEVAASFDCVPSQINYVLATRFTPARGYLVESQRGSGGHVRIRRIQLAPQSTLGDFLHSGLTEALTQDQARHICERLLHEELITKRECSLMVAALRRSSLPVSIPLRDQLRATILRAMLLELAQLRSVSNSNKEV